MEPPLIDEALEMPCKTREFCRLKIDLPGYFAGGIIFFDEVSSQDFEFFLNDVKISHVYLLSQNEQSNQGYDEWPISVS